MYELINTDFKWIGQIPKHWKITKIKYESFLKGRIGWQGLTSDEYVDEGPFLITGVDFKSGEIDWDNCVHVSDWRYKQAPDIYIHDNDLLITKDGTIGKLAITKNTPSEVTLNSGVMLIRSKSNSYENRYMYYTLLSNEFTKWFNYVNSGNTTIMHLYQHVFENFIFCMPPLEEQMRISDYLDKKCSKIDKSLIIIEEQINVLKKYRNSIITECVTKGLKNINSLKEKESWFLGIPNRWNVSKIGSLYDLRNTKVNDKDYEPLSVTMKGIVPQLENAAKTNAHENRKLVCKGDFAINSRSDRRGACGISPCDGSISLINIVLSPRTNMNPDYYNWLFHTEAFADEFYKWGHGIVDDLWTTGWQEMKNILIPTPPLEEQEEIAAYLADHCKKIDKEIIDKEKQFELLDNYKQSLIYEYVTGKKEVPNE